MRQLNFSSFGTQLETPARRRRRRRFPPLCRVPATERDGPSSSSPVPHRTPRVPKRVLRPLIPTFTRRTSAIANESRLAEPEPAATRFCAAPPAFPLHSLYLSPVPRVFSLPSFPPCFHVDPPHLLPFLLLSPNLPNRATARLQLPASPFSPVLSFPPPPHHVSLDSRGSTRTTLKDKGPRGTSGE